MDPLPPFKALYKVYFIHSILYTRFAFCGLVIERRIINLESLSIPKDQRTAHTAHAVRKKW